MRIYFAGPLFTPYERSFIDQCAAQLRSEGFEVFVPHEIPLPDPEYLANLTKEQFNTIFAGTIQMPMVDERVAIFNEVGRVLVEKYQGGYHNFVRSCSPRLYDQGNGLLERLVTEFPRFNDVSDYHGNKVQIFKLAQLGIWGMHLALSPRGHWKLEDASELTAFADYIVPVGLRVMGIFEYAKELEDQINNLQEVKRDSDAEVELRASSIYCIALLTEEINKRRPGMTPLLMPQLDFRFWKSYHATHWPHHLTPASRALRIWCSVTGAPAILNMGFGVESVSGANRVPFPPTRRIAFSIGDFKRLSFEQLQ